jgi:L-alanine-DL-glutamate epimerase-like enolase superfamily enzyme
MIRIYPVPKVLHPRHVFRISRASRRQVVNVFLAVEQDGVIGYGEASPNAYFGEDAADVWMRLAGLADFFLRRSLRTSRDIADIWDELLPRLSPSRAALCAVDVALWDLFARLGGRSVVDAVYGSPARAVPTSATLGLCPEEEWPERIAEAAEFPAIKLKLDAAADLGVARAVKAHSRAAIRVDANCAWSGRDLAALSEELASLGVEFIEQPLPREEDGRMPALLRASRLPIIADESCAVPEDVASLPGRFSGFNIKLVKCGGITPALRMLELAGRLGLKTMVGCMLESSLLISAGLVAAQRADYADLDGSWLLRDDPFAGLTIRGGCLPPPSGPGLGVSPATRYN